MNTMKICFQILFGLVAGWDTFEFMVFLNENGWAQNYADGPMGNDTIRRIFNTFRRCTLYLCLPTGQKKRLSLATCKTTAGC
jgi:hypothetical protein